MIAETSSNIIGVEAEKGVGIMAKEIILEDRIIRRKKIPVLVHSKEWNTLFNENMSKTMKKNAKELEEKVKEEKDALVKIKALKKLKKQLMDKIMQLSDDINSNKKGADINSLELAKQQILKANEQIDDLEYKLDVMPKEIEEKNLILLKETIQLAYSIIEEGSKKNDVLTKEIEELRQQLHDKWEEKIFWEKRTEEIYSYLHGTLGHKETNDLDKVFLKE